jgi:CspA family cold shock protein
MSSTALEVGLGVVTTYDTFKGFGFIRRAQGRDVFFVYDDINPEHNDIFVGDQVEFEVKSEPKGPRAYNIKKIIL